MPVDKSRWDEKSIRSFSTFYRRKYGEPASVFINLLRAALGKAPLPHRSSDEIEFQPEDYYAIHSQSLFMPNGNRRVSSAAP